MAIFINYRRSDSKGITGRIHEHLLRLLGNEEVFLDINTIPPGMRYRDYIQSQVDKCDIFLVIIGEHWVSERLKEKDDILRLEIEAALHREIPIIPVLVDGAELPEKRRLPTSIQTLVDYEKIDIESGRLFDEQIRLLVEAIRRLAVVRESHPVPPLSIPPKHNTRRRMVAAAVAVVVAGVGVALYFFLPNSTENTETIPALGQSASKDLQQYGVNSAKGHSGKAETLQESSSRSDLAESATSNGTNMRVDSDSDSRNRQPISETNSGRVGVSTGSSGKRPDTPPTRKPGSKKYPRKVEPSNPKPTDTDHLIAPQAPLDSELENLTSKKAASDNPIPTPSLPPQKVTLTVNAYPPAQIYFNGNYKGMSGQPIEVPPARYVITGVRGNGSTCKVGNVDLGKKNPGVVTCINRTRPASE